jgi:hypothetical protein
MASQLDQKGLEQAFEGRADIQAAIQAAAGISTSIVLSLAPPETGPFNPKIQKFH